jgi:membrane associated rhomboid family serine protease
LFVLAGIEMVLLAGDILGEGMLRRAVYELGAFWPGFLRDWEPLYPGQPLAMFVTYGFLHGGPLHLVFNVLALWTLGLSTLCAAGTRGFVLIYVVSLLCGAAGYASLITESRPMVGASGAIFGLLGALLAWNVREGQTMRRRLVLLLRVGVFLVVLQLVTWWSLSGAIAWQAHLGGFVSGWLVACFVD